VSIQVSVDEIEAAAADYGDAAYVVAAAIEGPPRITHSMVHFEDGDLIVSVGRRSAAALAINPAVSVLWPATAAQSMSLIVDGVVSGVVPAEGGSIRVAPSGAVRHRPASG